MTLHLTSIIKVNIHNLIFPIFIGILSGLKIGFSFLIPFNILPNANLDDALFFRLGENIASGQWLGIYENSTLIKGLTYPVFISLAIYSHIPLRILEAVLVCISCLYFVLLFKNFFNKKLILFFYALLIFYPLQYGSVDYRILRDTIYPQLLLLIFTALLYVLRSCKAKKVALRSAYVHVSIGCISIFLFFNTREESIWIAPILFFILIIQFLYFYKYKNILNFLMLGFFGIFIFIVSQNVLIKIQQSYYQTTIINLWKNKNFQEGFGSLQRLSGKNKIYDYITYENWESLFKVSPSLSNLKPYIYSPTYKNWINISCNSLRSQGYDIDKNSGCPNEVISGYILFALNNVLWAAGLKTPEEVSTFMQKISSEIDGACERKEIPCNPKPPSVLPAQISIDSINFIELINQFTAGLNLILNLQNPDFQNYSLDYDIQKTMRIRSALKAKIFDIGNKEFKVYPPNGGDEPKVSNNNFEGSIDNVVYRNRQLVISGWIQSHQASEISGVDIFINGHKACSTQINLQHQDEYNFSNVKLKFECTAPFEFIDDSPIKLSAYASNKKTSLHYYLKNTPLVTTVLSNKFDAKCYLANNLDVKYSVDLNKFTPEEHFRNYGIYEERSCAPLYSTKIAQQKYSQDIENHTIIRKTWFKTFFIINSMFYSYLIKFSPFIVVMYFFILIKKRGQNYLTKYALFIFGGLFLSRLFLISILGYLGLAPISPLYLTAGSYCLFIFEAICLIGILSAFQENKVLTTQ